MLLNDPYRFSSGGVWTPADLPDVTNFWDPSDATTITLSGSEVTAIADKVGTADLAKDGNGPAVLAVSGRDTLDFDATNSERMKVTSSEPDPAGGDWFSLHVFRTSSTDDICLGGKFGSGDPHYGSFIGLGATGAPYFQFRNVSASTWILNPTSVDYSDGNWHAFLMTYDDSEADLKMYLDTISDGNEVAQNLVAATGTISPSNPLYLSTWNGTDRHWEGQIGAVVYGKNQLVNATKTDLAAWLLSEFGIS